ncbi:hypothetical protein HK101_006398, partial [Irineochytrium annulatum]
ARRNDGRRRTEGQAYHLRHQPTRRRAEPRCHPQRRRKGRDRNPALPPWRRRMRGRLPHREPGRLRGRLTDCEGGWTSDREPEEREAD